MESGINESSTDVCLAGDNGGETKFRGRAGGSVTGAERRWWHGLAVHGIFWRKFVDWAVGKLPAVFHRPVIWVATLLFFFIAAPARKALLRNLRLIRPGSWRVRNYLRVLRVFTNFGWSLTDTAAYRMSKGRFRYELERARFIDQLGAARGGIVLTAHMGNYDLGAALFAERFHRQIRMVRAPEPDALAAQHVDLALRQSSAGAVKVGYSSDGPSLAFDLLNALRGGEIISIQGDRVTGGVSRAPVKFFGHEVFLPNGPFVLSLVSETPIYPLFIVRTGYRKYKIVAREPIVCSRGSGSRGEIIAEAMQRWAQVLEEIVKCHWQQWFAFTPLR
ncbi:MAG TPA: lysophospholipid acyltransferase family protein [Chthoniobacterales bacterium]|nr:lysophospholipid acyltransferase family protein [Chthoniobacterales bacterium]